MHCDNLRVLLVILVVFLVSDTVLCNSPVGDYFESVSGHQLEALLNDPGLLYSQNQLVYPLPDNRCSIQDRIRLSSCDVEARQDWNIRDTDYYTESRKFCCYVWDRLRCQLNILQYCDPAFANELSALSDKLYGDMCEGHGRGSASCALRWWSITLIVIAALLIVILIAIALFCCVQKTRKRRSKNDRTSTSSSADCSRTGSYTVQM